MQEFYIRNQQADHGWAYPSGQRAETRLTMTTAGLCGLLISGLELNAGRETIHADGRGTRLDWSAPPLRCAEPRVLQPLWHRAGRTLIRPALPGRPRLVSRRL